MIQNAIEMERTNIYTRWTLLEHVDERSSQGIPEQKVSRIAEKEP